MSQKNETRNMRDTIQRFQSYIALVVIFIIGSLICVKNGRNTFLSVTNLMNLLRAVSETGIIAIGMTMIVLLGDIDLSVGSVVSSDRAVSEYARDIWHVEPVNFKN